MYTHEQVYAVCNTCLLEFFAEIIWYADQFFPPHLVTPNELYTLIFSHHLKHTERTHNIFDLFKEKPDIEILKPYYLQSLRPPAYGTIVVAADARPNFQFSDENIIRKKFGKTKW